MKYGEAQEQPSCDVGGHQGKINARGLPLGARREDPCETCVRRRKVLSTGPHPVR